MIKLISTKEEMQRYVKAHQSHSRIVAVVPTMGGLHDGHLSLIKQAAADSEIVTVTIYLNPTQFAAHEDLENYPRMIEDDLDKLAKQGLAHAVYVPANMYHDNHATMVTPKGVASALEGVYRPHFFVGVATIVLKLFNHVPANRAYFGEKDFQQLAVIRQMVNDLDLPIEINAVPTARDKDGLALSSRNQYLSDVERQIAPQLYKQMQICAKRLAAGEEAIKILEEAQKQLLQAGFTSIDYFELRHGQTFESSYQQEEARLFAALYLGKTRLIDNEAITKLCDAQ